MTETILIVDDEQAIRESLQGLLEDEGYSVITAASGEEAIARYRKQHANCVLLDIWMPGIDGLETMNRLQQMDRNIPIILMSGHATIDTAVRATKQGAFDFVEKPLSSDKLLILIRNALEKQKLFMENASLKDNLRLKSSDELIGNSAVIRNVRKLIERVAMADTSVLILGEHGTGKAIAARMLHNFSRRQDAPFFELNVASIPEQHINSELFGHEKGAFPGALHAQRGRFEAAHKGTLFFDEICDLKLSTQAKILRAMQERSIQRQGNPSNIPANVRVIGASTSDPESMLREGKLREEFYYRLNVITIQLPPLRERLEDLPLLVETLSLEQAALLGGQSIHFHATVLETMRQYPWQGNVRELRNFIERCHILFPGEEITPDNMPALDNRSGNQTTTSSSTGNSFTDSFQDARESFEKHYLLHHLEKHQWNISKTAKDIGMERSQLHRKIKSFNFMPPGKDS